MARSTLSIRSRPHVSRVQVSGNRNSGLSRSSPQVQAEPCQAHFLHRDIYKSVLPYYLSLIVIVTLPEINLTVTITDEQSMALLPSNADVGIDSLLRYSRQDAENEAKESTELISIAQDNLKATIEGLLFPILKTHGYSISWN